MKNDTFSGLYSNMRYWTKHIFCILTLVLLINSSISGAISSPGCDALVTIRPFNFHPQPTIQFFSNITAIDALDTHPIKSLCIDEVGTFDEMISRQIIEKTINHSTIEVDELISNNKIIERWQAGQQAQFVIFNKKTSTGVVFTL